MSKNTTPGVPGQDPTPTDNTNPTKPEDMGLLEGIEALQNRLDASLPRVRRLGFLRDIVIALRRAAWATEKLIETAREVEPVSENEEALDTEPEPEPEPEDVASLAWASNGDVLLSSKHLTKEALKGRERWTGIVLNEREAFKVLGAMSDASDDTAAHIGGAIIAKAKRAREGGEGGGQS
ncbi:MAG: hypothetical protein HUU21_00415 [Polyangiaceae bacterium]|nr:hypothetical protein [Polyangiaceae bacterium]